MQFIDILPSIHGGKDVIERIGLSEDAYFGFMPLTRQQAHNILKLGQVNESFIIN